MSAQTGRQPPRWAAVLRGVNEYLMFDLGPGGKPLKLSTVINLHKGGSLLFFALLIWWYADRVPQATSIPAFVYLGLHGGYGLIWLIKDFAFPDRNWHRPCTIGSALLGFAALGLYWSIGYLVIAGISPLDYPLPAGPWLALCIVLGMVGAAVMIAADAQKYTALGLRPGLIRDGMFARIRHPNYLGEMMVYASFAMVAWHWWAAVVLAIYWLGMFAPNIAAKEASMSRYPQWPEYCRRSGRLLPRR